MVLKIFLMLIYDITNKTEGDRSISICLETCTAYFISALCFTFNADKMQSPNP